MKSDCCQSAKLIGLSSEGRRLQTGGHKVGAVRNRFDQARKNPDEVGEAAGGIPHELAWDPLAADGHLDDLTVRKVHSIVHSAQERERACHHTTSRSGQVSGQNEWYSFGTSIGLLCYTRMTTGWRRGFATITTSKTAFRIITVF